MHFFFNRLDKKRRRGRHTHKRTFWQHWGEYIWPSMGIFGFLRWIEIKIKRSSETRDRIAMGAAIGIFVTFVPLMGLQIVIMWLLCRILNGHFGISVLSSLVGNPWTFPFIWLISHQFGMFILMKDHAPFPPHFTLEHVWQNLDFYWNVFIFPTTVGGIPLGLIAAIAVYYIVHFHVSHYQKTRKSFLENRRKEETEKRKLSKLAAEKLTATAEKLKDTAATILPNKKDSQE